jgi:flagellar basal-body rod protein FlgG
MMRSLLIAKTGLEAMQTQLDVITNNLANVNTNGFKRSRAVFEDLLYQNVRQPGGQTSQSTQLPSGLQLGTGVKAVAAERLFLQGNLQQTGNDKDVAIQGNGLFQVLMPDGNTAYTRDGEFQVDSQGYLVTASGYQLQPAMTIPATAQSLTIGKDGTVSYTEPAAGGAAPTTVAGIIELASFINTAGLEAKGENLYVETTASGAPIISQPTTNGLGSLNQHYVESSNVSVVEEMTNMIQAQRSYEINSKAVSTSDQMLQTLSQL